MQNRMRIGTRSSALALAQTRFFVATLARAHGWSSAETEQQTEIIQFKTTGDRVQDRPLADIGGKGLFAKELEEALLDGTIDCAVHSLKDMLPELLPGLFLACHLPREDPRDAFISRIAANLDQLPDGAVVGTSSVRRQAILLNRRPDLKPVMFRGNVETRLDKLAGGEVAATVLAIAGLKRLGIEAHARHIFTTQEMLPAVAQGTIAIETRAADLRLRNFLSPCNHLDTELAVTLERAFLGALNGTCKTPIAGLAVRQGPTSFKFEGCVLSPDGRKRVDVSLTIAITTSEEADAAGRDAGRDLLSRSDRHLFET